MKKLLTLSFCLSVHVLFAQVFVGYSNPVVLSKEELPSEKIYKDVLTQMEKWMEKKPTEDISSYEKRVSDEKAIQQKKELFISNAISVVAGPEVALDIPKTKYDDINQTLELQFGKLDPIYVHIPSGDEYLSFLDNLSNIDKQNVRYAVKDEKYLITHLELLNPANGIEYNYDISMVSSIKFRENVFGAVSLENNLDFSNDKTGPQTETQNIGISDVDRDLPEAKIRKPDAVAIIIGNRDYKAVGKLTFAINDAKSVKNYLVKSLGYDPANVVVIENATKANFETYFSKDGILESMVKSNSDVFIYYSGHGVPSLKNKKQYFMPVDADPGFIEKSGYSFEEFYSNLSKIKVKSYTIAIDACFSGAVYEDAGLKPGLIPVEESAMSLTNGIVFTASSANQVSLEDKEKKHGLFTYYFLKALQDKFVTDKDKDNQITYQEIFNYINNDDTGIPYRSKRLKSQQIPTLRAGEEFKNIGFMEY
jgi:hypothetical protein